jgi:hypothetical protein
MRALYLRIADLELLRGGHDGRGKRVEYGSVHKHPRAVAAHLALVPRRHNMKRISRQYKQRESRPSTAYSYAGQQGLFADVM